MRRRATLLTPFDPSALGNGSSRRAARWCEALSTRFDVDVVVVPVVSSGPAGVSPYRTVALPTEAERRAGAARLMEPRWREWMTVTAPLPRLAEAAPAWLGREVLRDVLHGAAPDVVVAFKIALAPMAADLALSAGGVPLVIDLDDDEVTLAASVGEDGAALERLLQGVGRLGDTLDLVLTVAAPSDAEHVRARIGRPVHTVPNVVDVTSRASGASRTPARAAGRLLFVGNFGYSPNREAAAWLRREVVPHLVGVTRLDLVGPGSEAFGGVGFVDDVEPFYAEASVVLCPLLSGSGTSLKVLDALGHERAVVTTTVGARGLDVESGEHLLIVDEPLEFAAAVNGLLADPARTARLAASGRALVESSYSSSVGVASMLAAVDAVLDV